MQVQKLSIVFLPKTQKSQERLAFATDEERERKEERVGVSNVPFHSPHLSSPAALQSLSTKPK